MPNKDQIRDYLVSNTIDKMVEFLIVNENLSLDQAMDMVYSSDTIKKLQNVEGELFVQSPEYVYELLQKELYPDNDGHEGLVAESFPDNYNL